MKCGSEPACIQLSSALPPNVTGAVSHTPAAASHTAVWGHSDSGQPVAGGEDGLWRGDAASGLSERMLIRDATLALLFRRCCSRAEAAAGCPCCLEEYARRGVSWPHRIASGGAMIKAIRIATSKNSKRVKARSGFSSSSSCDHDASNTFCREQCPDKTRHYEHHSSGWLMRVSNVWGGYVPARRWLR